MKGLPFTSSTTRSEERRGNGVGRIDFTYPLVNKPPYTTVVRFSEPSVARGLNKDTPLRSTAAIVMNMVSRYSKTAMCYSMRPLTAPPDRKRRS
ncbi:hypothetical protein AVEN_194087-1 [Araneus ventricosus]|uniref:Uncharacterized protein n=1 Tax=Araneus ventricosus TaxID=182803 RepID=A0A4Y2JAM0_ARAVE|nr:hypothetical protein AVEN_194087-1 [Araneus ventricosus]